MRVLEMIEGESLAARLARADGSAGRRHDWEEAAPRRASSVSQRTVGAYAAWWMAQQVGGDGGR